MNYNPETGAGSTAHFLTGDMSMSRRRWQRGSLLLRGKHVKQWILRFLEDQVDSQGKIKRVHKSEVLGGLDEFPTKRSAQRAAERRLADVNSASYTPKHRITIKQASEQYLKHVCPAFKLASQASVKSNMKIIVGHFGQLPVSELSLARVQAWVTSLDKSPKTVSNYITTFCMLWKHCRASGYVTHNPFEFLTLPRAELREPASFSPAQIREIIERAPEPYSTMFWLTAETGCRGGELCGLYRDDIDVDARMIYVRRSAFQGQLQTPKTSNAVRAFPISQALAEHIRKYTENVHGQTNRQALLHESPERAGTMYPLREEDKQSGAGKGCAPRTLPETSLLFITPRGCPYDNGNIVKRGLKPILRAMGIDSPRTGLHAFRHASASAMDSLGVPNSVRTARLGHSSMKMTMRYSHAMSEDHRAAADGLGELFAPRGEQNGSGSSGRVTGDQQPTGPNNGYSSNELGYARNESDERQGYTSVRGSELSTDERIRLTPADSHTETTQVLRAKSERCPPHCWQPPLEHRCSLCCWCNEKFRVSHTETVQEPELAMAGD